MISKTSLQVLSAMTELAKLPPRQRIGAAVIARKIKAPCNYLSKVLQGMASRGLVDSYKGRGGGFSLAIPAEDITLYQIVDAVEGLEKWHKCFMKKPHCHLKRPCAMHERWAIVRGGYICLLKETHLRDLI